MNVLLCSFSDPGYLYPALAVGRELRRRGHRVLVLGRAGGVPTARAAGLGALDAAEYDGAGGFSVGRWTRGGEAQFRAVRHAAREFRAGVLVTSVLGHGALLAGEALGLPVVVLGFAAHLWPYASGGEGEPQRVVLREWRLRELLRHYRELRERIGLPPRRDRRPDRPLIGSGLLLRGHPALEYPGAALPEGVWHAGPCSWEPAADPGEVDRIDHHLARVGKPVVYVHLGRQFGGRSLWPALNEAFTEGPFQAVVEQGRSGDPSPAAGADVLVVRRPWMGPLVERAALVLTNGTTSPVLTALRHGTPLAVAPAGSEQPLLAEACVRAGVAVRFSGGDSPGSGVAALAAALDGPLPERARRLGAALCRGDGAAAAADHVIAAASLIATGRSGGPGAGHRTGPETGQGTRQGIGHGTHGERFRDAERMEAHT
ncbi:glycosyltransferase [Microbispora sp. CA-135349]|uniref:glycosyltransferase n=1 Tax=Microbispora sp. CA-135349 TaxID=3239953 RepID=UPI003D89C782